MADDAGMTSSKSMRTEFDFDTLPGIPGSWLDFLNSRLPVAPALHAIDGLAARTRALREQASGFEYLVQFLIKTADTRCARAQENLHRLQKPGSLAVSTTLSPGLLGGPAIQLLKCLTVLKVSEELSRRQIAAVPVCWIRDSIPAGFPAGSVRLLDSESTIHSLQLQTVDAGNISARDPLLEGPIKGILEQISEIGRDAFDPETIDIIHASYCPGTTLSEATAKLISALMEEWGLIVLNPGAPGFPLPARENISDVSQGAIPAHILQSLLTPSAICVLDYGEIEGYADVQQTYRALNRLSPLSWPYSGATIADVRSRRILERYSLNLVELYSGAEDIIKTLSNDCPTDVPGRLLELKQEVESRVDPVRALYSSEQDFDKEIASIRNRIGFQLNRLQEKYDASCKRRRETTERHIHRVCNALAPNRRMQEKELAGILWPLRYSRRVLRSLYDRLDILKPQHQLILMD